MDRVRVYLSGGMGALSFKEQSKWRKQVIDAIKFGEYDYDKKVIFFNPVDHYNFEDKVQKTEAEVMEYDLYKLRNSDLVIVNFNDEKSIGTAMELMLAKELHIPIIGLNKDKKELHPWLTCCCNRMCDDMRELVSHVVEFYLK